LTNAFDILWSVALEVFYGKAEGRRQRAEGKTEEWR